MTCGRLRGLKTTTRHASFRLGSPVAQLLQQRLRGLLEEGILGVAADLHQAVIPDCRAGHVKYADVSIVTGVLPDANTVIVPPVPTFTIAEFEIDPPGV